MYYRCGSQLVAYYCHSQHYLNEEPQNCQAIRSFYCLCYIQILPLVHNVHLDRDTKYTQGREKNFCTHTKKKEKTCSTWPRFRALPPLGIFLNPLCALSPETHGMRRPSESGTARWSRRDPDLPLTLPQYHPSSYT